MARNRKTESPPMQPQEQGLELSEEEQWRLINESGVLQKGSITAEESQAEAVAPLAEEIFNSVLLIIPCSFCLLMMEMQEPTFNGVVERMLSGVPILSILVFYTNRHKKDRMMQLFLFVVSIAVGMRMIYLVNHGSWLVNMRQCPPLATAWVYAIVQLDLGPSMASLVIIGGWVKWTGMKLVF